MRTHADPRGAEAAARVESFFADLEHIGWEDLGSISFPTDTSARAVARAAAATAAAEAGRAPFLAETRNAAGDWVLRAYSAGMYQPTFFGLNWGRSTGTLPDRVAVAGAVEDAATAAIVEDLVQPAVFDELRAPFELIVAMHPTGRPDASATRAGRWTRPVAATLLIGLALGSLVYAYEFGLLAVVIPVIMVVAIFAGLTRSRPAA